MQTSGHLSLTQEELQVTMLGKVHKVRHIWSRIADVVPSFLAHVNETAPAFTCNFNGTAFDDAVILEALLLDARHSGDLSRQITASELSAYLCSSTGTGNSRLMPGEVAAEWALGAEWHFRNLKRGKPGVSMRLAATVSVPIYELCRAIICRSQDMTPK